MTLMELIQQIDASRLTARALDMLQIPSPTGHTRIVAEYFAEACRDLGGSVTVIEEIPDAPSEYDAPSVAALWRFGEGPTLQIDGHTDTIDMPHSPAELRDGRLTGRGAVDMKASVAAAIEAINVISGAGIHIPGSLLLTTHGMHEAPLGHGEGLRALIAAGFFGDAAVVAEGPADELALVGRGMAIWDAHVYGPAESGHENSTPRDTPHPIIGASELVVALNAERLKLAQNARPYVGCETLFIGQIHSGDFYNRFPTQCYLQGTRRYFADHQFEDVTTEFRALCDRVAARTKTRIEVRWDRIRDGYEVPEDANIVRAYQNSYRRIEGREMQRSAFMSVGDVSILAGEAGIPAVYCGNRATGAHSDLEIMPVSELVNQAAHLIGIIAEYFGVCE